MFGTNVGILRRSAIRQSSIAMAFLATILPLCAYAQNSQEIAARRELLNQAQIARDGGDHQRALDLAVRAGNVSMSPSVQLFIAEERAELGQLSHAWGDVELTIREAERSPTLPNREAILSRARVLQASLAARVARLVIQVPPELNELVVTINGQPLQRSFWGVPYVVDPGENTVEATATGRSPFRFHHTLREGQTHVVQVRLGDAVVRSPENRPRISPVGPVVAGVGGAGLIAGTVLAVVSNQQFDTALRTCVGMACNTAADQIATLDAATVGSFVTAGALVATGTVLLFVLRPRESAREDSETEVSIGPQSVGITVHF